MAMSINNLKIFINVADAESITRAAEALHITQPSVSKAVKNLEDELGVALFFRDKRNGLALTGTGERILGFARQLMLMEERIYQTAYMARNMLEGTLKIATLPYGSIFFLVKAFSRFQERYPQVNVEITERPTSEVNRLVSEHAVEFGISVIPVADFEYELLKKDRIVAISGNPLDLECVDLSKLKQKFYVSQSAWESILPVLEQNHIKNYGRFKVVSIQTVRAIAEAGIGIGLQAESILPENTTAYFKYPIKPQVNTDFVLIANKFDDLSPAAKAFIKTIHEIMRDLESQSRSSKL